MDADGEPLELSTVPSGTYIDKKMKSEFSCMGEFSTQKNTSGHVAGGVTNNNAEAHYWRIKNAHTTLVTWIFQIFICTPMCALISVVTGYMISATLVFAGRSSTNISDFEILRHYLLAVIWHLDNL